MGVIHTQYTPHRNEAVASYSIYSTEMRLWLHFPCQERELDHLETS